MLKLIGVIISICLILLIFLRIPQENAGLSSFSVKGFSGYSFSSTERSLNLVTIFLILVYFGIAIQLNLT